MNCLPDEDLLAAQLEELAPSEVVRLDEHERGCDRCRTTRRRIQEVLDDLAAPTVGAPSTTTFVADVLGRCAREPEVADPRQDRRVWPWVSAVFALAALLALTWATSRLSQRPEMWAARGTKSSPGVYAQVMAVHGDTFRPVEGATLRPGDGLAVRYWNTTTDIRYLMAFAVDAKGTMHWIYPKYVDAAGDPQSIAIAPTAGGRLLDEVVEPETPEQGVMRVTVLITRRPLSVKMLEERASAGQLRDSLPFEVVNTQTWSATWQDR